MVKILLAKTLGSAIYQSTRLLKLGGGSAAPGLYALKIDPNLVSKLAKQIPFNIIITGTNGKTTTSKLLAHFAQAAKLKVLRNHTGSNLERGIASAMLSGGNLKKYDLGLWELDEAAFNTVAPKLNPKVVVFLNAYRDQLDRYGEVDTVVKKWCEALKKIPRDTKILINGDDANTVKLKNFFEGEVQTFGLESFKVSGENGSPMISKRKLDFKAGSIKADSLEKISFKVSSSSANVAVELPIPGTYHIYDFLAAFASGLAVGIPIETMIESCKNYSPAFGRVEQFKMGEQIGYIFLVKNPTGATEVFKTIAPQLKKDDVLLMALNDNFADGTDVSWIWDADFEKLSVISHQTSDFKIFCAGSRAYDLAVRLKYSGFEADSIEVISSLEEAFKSSKQGLNGRLFVLPTYTAMLEFQRILVKEGIKKEYWKEDT